MLLLKGGAQGATGRRSLLDKRNEPMGIDVAYLKDVDLEGMLVKDTAETTADYYKAVDFVLAELEKGRTINDCVVNALLGVRNRGRVARRAVSPRRRVLYTCSGR